MSQIQGKHLTFTDYNEEKPVWRNDMMSYLVFQREACPTTGKQHWQGYVEFTTKRSVSALSQLLHPEMVALSKRAYKDKKKFEALEAEVPQALLDALPGPIHVHGFKARGTAEQNREYCSKSETSLEGTFEEYGEAVARTQGERTDLTELRDMIRAGKTDAELLDHNASYAGMSRHIGFIRNSLSMEPIIEKKSFYLYGDANAGKTTFAYEYCETHGLRLFRTLLTGDKIWYDGYNDEEAILLDDYVPSAHGNHVMSEIMTATDKYSVRLPVKCGTRVPKFTTVFVSSNFEPPTIAAFIRRYDHVVKFRIDALHERSMEDVTDFYKEVIVPEAAAVRRDKYKHTERMNAFYAKKAGLVEKAEV